MIFAPIELFAQTDEDIIESIKQEEIIRGNQTINNIVVTIKQNTTSINGSVMISSAIVIGFTSLGALIEVAKLFEYARSQLRSISIVYTQIGVLIILHLTVIFYAYTGDLDESYYFLIIILTILLVIGMLVSTLWLVFEKERAVQRREAYVHELENDLENTRAELLRQFTQNMDDEDEEEDEE